MSNPPTLAQRLGFGSQRASAKPTTPAKPAPTDKPARPRDASTGIDARDLSPADYERRLADFGLSAPGTDHRRLAPPIDPEAQRVARRALERAERRAARGHVQAQEARTVELSAGAVDGRNASASDVRARLASLGIDSTPSAVTVAEVGRGLEARRDKEVDYGSRVATARQVVTEALALCDRTGQHLDTRRLNEWELIAYRQIRGLDPA